MIECNRGWICIACKINSNNYCSGDLLIRAKLISAVEKAFGTRRDRTEKAGKRICDLLLIYKWLFFTGNVSILNVKESNNNHCTPK